MGVFDAKWIFGREREMERGRRREGEGEREREGEREWMNEEQLNAADFKLQRVIRHTLAVHVLQ